MLLYDMLLAQEKAVVDTLGPKLNISNVANYYFCTHPKEYWDIQTEFPNAKVPFSSCWMEYRIPKVIWSKEKGFTENPICQEGIVPYGTFCAFSSQPGDIFPRQYAISCMVFLTRHDKIIHVGKDVPCISYDVSPNGNLIIEANKFLTNQPGEMVDKLYQFHPALMALSFLNCHNIEVVDIQAPQALQKARARRGKHPLVTYKVINILEGQAYQPKHRSVTSTSSEGIALHIRRGHFVRYGEQYGRGKLFGKYSGMFWHPQTTVGTLDAGVSVHDYNLGDKHE